MKKIIIILMFLAFGCEDMEPEITSEQFVFRIKAQCSYSVYRSILGMDDSFVTFGNRSYSYAVDTGFYYISVQKEEDNSLPLKIELVYSRYVDGVLDAQLIDSGSTTVPYGIATASIGNY